MDKVKKPAKKVDGKTMKRIKDLKPDKKQNWPIIATVDFSKNPGMKCGRQVSKDKTKTFYQCVLKDESGQIGAIGWGENVIQSFENDFAKGKTVIIKKATVEKVKPGFHIYLNNPFQIKLDGATDWEPVNKKKTGKKSATATSTSASSSTKEKAELLYERCKKSASATSTSASSSTKEKADKGKKEKKVAGLKESKSVGSLPHSLEKGKKGKKVAGLKGSKSVGSLPPSFDATDKRNAIIPSKRKSVDGMENHGAQKKPKLTLSEKGKSVDGMENHGAQKKPKLTLSEKGLCPIKIDGKKANFGKDVDDTVQQSPTTDHYWLFRKVGGLYIGEQHRGTVFRVGSRFAMTCLHLVDKLVDPTKGDRILETVDVYLLFGDGPVTGDKYKVSREVICLRELDVLILEILVPENAPPLPRPFRLAHEDMTPGTSHLTLAGFGHPNKDKNVEPCQIVNVSEETLAGARKLIKELFKYDADEYNINLNIHIAVNAFQKHGASGGPLIETHSQGKMVRAIYTRGVPTSYYNGAWTEEMRSLFPKELVCEVGTKIKAVYECLVQRPHLLPLVEDLFSPLHEFSDCAPKPDGL